MKRGVFIAIAQALGVWALTACSENVERHSPEWDEIANKPRPGCASASDVSTALVQAKSCDTRIELESARTETGRVFVNPDGTSTIEEYAYPQRVRRADGTWSKLDATLAANPDGTFSPRASVVDLTLSGGGDGRLLSGRRNGQEIALFWPGTLPKPAVAGPVATYAEVFSGVDLVLTASDAGFSEVVVVKNRAAAANPAVRRIVFGTAMTGLKWQDDEGHLRVVDGEGRTVLAATAPRMWDSSAAALTSGGRLFGDVSGPAEGARSAPIRLDVTESALALSPNETLLDDPSAEFPLFLDPTITYSAWTMINDQFPNQSYWSFDKTDCPSGFSTECAKVGQIFGGTMDYRSMFQFSTSQFLGKQILGSKLTIDLLWSAFAANSVTELHQINASIGSGTTWNNNAGAWSGTVAASVSNANHGGARKGTEFGSGTLTSILQGVANGGAGTTTWGLKANTETSSNPWKKFDAKTARLVVTTNTTPGKPDTLTVDGKPCVSGTNRPVIATATPVLRARATDPDGDSLDVWFAYAKWNGSGFADVGNGHQSPIPNGGFAQIVTSSLDHGGIYTFRAQSNDSPSHAGTAFGTSPVTASPGNCEWEVDLVDPNPPTVQSEVYPENCDSCGAVGKTGTFALSSSADVVYFKWGFSSPPSTVATPASTGAPVSVDWTPATGGAKTLFVQAVDRAGRTATKNYQFYVAPPSPAVARWKLDEPAGSTTLRDDTGNGRDATVFGGATLGARGRIVPGPDGAPRTAMSFDGVDDFARASTTVLAHTSQSFSVSAWVKLGDNTKSREILSQGGFNNSAFLLEYVLAGQGVWKITAPTADSGAASYPGAQSTSVPRVDSWTHLVGVYDSAAKTLQLYVNGALEGTATGITTWDAGTFQIGANNPFKGSLGEIQVWDRVLSAQEAFDLSDPLVVGRVADWRMEEVGPGPAVDSSDLAHDLTFYNGAVVPPSNSGHTGTGLSLDGVDDYAAPDGPVLYTDDSFTVSAWVLLADKAASYNVIAQPGNVYSPFYLQYNVFYDRWLMNTSSGDDDPVVWSNAPRSTSVPAATTWTHLVAVYDAQKGETRLYVNGKLEGTSTGVRTWGSSGAPRIGAGFKGNIDEVRLFQGAVADVTRIP